MSSNSWLFGQRDHRESRADSVPPWFPLNPLPRAEPGERSPQLWPRLLHDKNALPIQFDRRSSIRHASRWPPDPDAPTGSDQAAGANLSERSTSILLRLLSPVFIAVIARLLRRTRCVMPIRTDFYSVPHATRDNTGNSSFFAGSTKKIMNEPSRSNAMLPMKGKVQF